LYLISRICHFTLREKTSHADTSSDDYLSNLDGRQSLRTADIGNRSWKKIPPVTLFE
jgi:hypothetical protein